MSERNGRRIPPVRPSRWPVVVGVVLALAAALMLFTCVGGWELLRPPVEADSR